jgi:tRNA 2-selenouridine synthase
MPDIVPAETFRQLLADQTPLIDVRAPLEFSHGSIPGAVNLPLLEDREREAVGKAYRTSGQQAAIELGRQLVSGEVRQERMARWVSFVTEHPHAMLYCLRGGLRSRTAQEWLQESGLPVPRIAGGYKALRRFLIESINRASASCDLLMVGGKTGCGKTELVKRLEASVDLEGLANHRGSAFGRRVTPQPSQIDFENRLALQLLQLPFENFRRLVLEDEGRAIGSLAIPLVLFERMRSEPLALIEEPLPARVDTVLHAYIEVNYGDFLAGCPETAEPDFREHLLSALLRIRKRLGPEHYEEIRYDLVDALRCQFQGEGFATHRVWIEKLLRYYYDPMYAYQLEKKVHRIVFRGDHDEFLGWAAHLQFKKVDDR